MELYTCSQTAKDSEIPADWDRDGGGRGNITIPQAYNELATLISVTGGWHCACTGRGGGGAGQGAAAPVLPLPPCARPPLPPAPAHAATALPPSFTPPPHTSLAPSPACMQARTRSATSSPVALTASLATPPPA